MSTILVTGRLPHPAIDALSKAHEIDYRETDGPIPRKELLQRVAGKDAMVCLLTEKVDAELLAAAGPQLKIVANVAVGFNNIDVAACDGAGVVATNTPRVLTEATADLAFGSILMVTRRLSEAERVIRTGQTWQWGMFFMLGTGLQGKTLGVLGMGAIGQAVARRAKAFGMVIEYSDERELDPAVAAELGARRVDQDELLRTADVITLHAPLTPATQHLIDDKALAMMKSSAYLINTSRGPVVDEAALAKALATGQIAGAALDVFENEPQVNAELLKTDRAVLLPHIGSATVETRTAMAELAAENVLAVLGGRPALTPVTQKAQV
ncbi:MAG: D-glycerate dehydrogenase [Austwickia sp.]|nr:D-glycerate dehydrogenase [Actinomycetota bacterium]MCB1251855.1 D-glycerate dehydrogenase [Austwickia sp.]MCO5311280.1 D-glycerate dehydrogenase [Austwickia sp.]